MLKLTHLTVGYREKTVLKDVSLHVREGEICVLLGQNASGKTTLLRSLIGLSDIQGGKATLFSQNLSTLSHKKRAQSVAYLAQGKTPPEITLEGLVLHGRFPHLSYPRRYRATDYAKAREAMETLGIAECAGARLKTLSGGTVQKAYLAMALCQEARLLLLDEPTTYLDLGAQKTLFSLLRSLSDEGHGVLVSLHSVADALHLADKIALLHDGALAFFGTPKELLASGMLEKIYRVALHVAETEYGDAYFFEKE